MIKEIEKITCSDSKKNTKNLINIVFSAKENSTNQITWRFVGGNKEYKIQEIEKHTGIKVEYEEE